MLLEEAREDRRLTTPRRSSGMAPGNLALSTLRGRMLPEEEVKGGVEGPPISESLPTAGRLEVTELSEFLLGLVWSLRGFLRIDLTGWLLSVSISLSVSGHSDALLPYLSSETIDPAPLIFGRKYCRSMAGSCMCILCVCMCVSGWCPLLSSWVEE